MKTKLNLTKNDIPEDARRAMVELLNQQLADAIDLGLQCKQAHWNVKGANFLSLHELFDKAAEEVADYADELAERAVELGGIAIGVIRKVAAGSRLSPYPENISSGIEHIKALSDALAKFGTSARAGIAVAVDFGDANTTDLFTEVSRGVDKLLWMVEAHLQTTN